MFLERGNRLLLEGGGVHSVCTIDWAPSKKYALQGFLETTEVSVSMIVEHFCFLVWETDTNSSQENSGEFEGFISNWKRRSKTLKSSEYLLFWVENERNSFCVVLTDQVKGRVCALFSEISIENF